MKTKQNKTLLKQNSILYMKISFKGEGKYYFRHNQADESHHQQTSTTRDVEGHHLGRKKLIPDENLNLYKEF